MSNTKGNEMRRYKVRMKHGKMYWYTKARNHREAIARVVNTVRQDKDWKMFGPSDFEAIEVTEAE